ncbi:MAG: transglutaminase-like domain-containing protein [Rickettsiales bacterium]|nr:transglutaminase-like domain-containing protein [Rickettsiales bacterium]
MGCIKKYWIWLPFFLVLEVSALADLKIKSWNQRNVFNSQGQEIEVVMKLKAESLPKNHYYDSWGIIFDKKSKINILEVRTLQGDKIHWTFRENKLELKFNNLFDSQEILLGFKYQIDNDEIYDIPYIRQELTEIPSFVSGAQAVLEVKILDNMTLYSLNHLFSINDNIFIWSGVVGKNGFRDVFRMTKNYSTWKVSTVVDIEDTSGIGNLTVKLPLDYIGGNNDTIEYNISSGHIGHIDGNFIEKKKTHAVAKFKNFKSTKSFVRIDAVLRNNYSNFSWDNDFKFEATAQLKSDYAGTLSALANEIIINSEEEKELPMHIRIAKWVNKNIVYDRSFVGKKMTSLDILNIRKGVCEHYAILYQDLLRSINIPSKTVVGLSFNSENRQFESHAWVMVYYNDQWIPIDPTWGIYSGKLPISHIFMYNNLDSTISYSRFGSLKSLRTNISHNVEFLE